MAPASPAAGIGTQPVWWLARTLSVAVSPAAVFPLLLRWIRRNWAHMAELSAAPYVKAGVMGCLVLVRVGFSAPPPGCNLGDQFRHSTAAQRAT